MVYVVDGLREPLLGRSAVEGLRLVNFVDNVEVNGAIVFRSFFLGWESWVMFLIKLGDGAEPYAVTVPRRVFAARREPLQRELEND